MDVSVTPRLRYMEFSPPAEFGAWVEAIALLVVPETLPRRVWYRIPDARARFAFPLEGEPGTLLPPMFAKSVTSTPKPSSYAIVRFAPWATGPLRLASAVSASRAPWHDLRIDCRRGTAHAGDVFSEVIAKLRTVLAVGDPDPQAVTAWRALSRDSRLSVDALARLCDISARTLLRSIQDASLCTIRTARTLQRLRRALRLLRSDLSLSWSRAALSAGFYDQAHFARTFQHLVGLAPTRFFEESHHHFNDVFARAVAPSGAPPIVAIGDTVLRGRHERRRLERDGRRKSSPIMLTSHRRREG